MAETLRKFSQTHDCASFSEAARHLVLQSDFFARSDIVLGYLFHGLEADCTGVLYSALQMGKLVGLPRILPGTCDMDFYLLDDTLNFGDQIECGSYGISEPVPTLEKLALDASLAKKRVLVLVPGLAFSEDGRRLGRGKGFYDRYIARLRETGAELTLAGFCFPCQIVENLPVDGHDIPMDIVFGALRG